MIPHDIIRDGKVVGKIDEKKKENRAMPTQEEFTKDIERAILDPSTNILWHTTNESWAMRMYYSAVEKAENRAQISLHTHLLPTYEDGAGGVLIRHWQVHWEPHPDYDLDNHEFPEPKDLVQIIRDNPCAVAVIDEQGWALNDADGHELVSSDDEVIPLGNGGWGSGPMYGGDVLQALAKIVGIRIVSL